MLFRALVSSVPPRTLAALPCLPLHVAPLHSSTAALARSRPSGNLNPLANPTPTLVVSSHADVARGKNKSNFSSAHKQGHRLNEYERRAANAAQTLGYLAMGPHCGISVLNAHLRYCYARRWPYMAISAHGDNIVVDVAPVGGVGDVDSESAYKVILGWQAVLKGLQSELPHGLQVSNVESRVDPSTVDATALLDIVETPRVDADSEIGDQFTILVSKRKDAVHVASSLWSWFTAAFDVASPEELAAAKAEKHAARKAIWERRMVRKLRALVADPKRLRGVPRGSLNGFIKAEAEGTTHAGGQ